MHDRFPAARWLLAGGAVALLAGAGGLSALALRHSQERLIDSVSATIGFAQNVDLAREAQVHFKRPVQEWKNVLIRGHNPDGYAKYWSLFEAEENKTPRAAGLGGKESQAPWWTMKRLTIRSPEILIVDDTPLNLDVLTILLANFRLVRRPYEPAFPLDKNCASEFRKSLRPCRGAGVLCRGARSVARSPSVWR